MKRRQGAVTKKPARSLAGLKAKYPSWPHWASLERFLRGVAGLRPRTVVLFGSLAKGDFTQHSDADVLVVFARPVDWLEVYQHSDGLVQPVVKTLGEIEAQISEGNTFLIEALEDGVALLDQEETFAKLLGLCQEAKARLGLRRVAGGWRGMAGEHDEGAGF